MSTEELDCENDELDYEDEKDEEGEPEWEPVPFPARILRLLEAGAYQQAADQLWLHCHDEGYFTPQVKVPAKPMAQLPVSRAATLSCGTEPKELPAPTVLNLHIGTVSNLNILGEQHE